VLAEDLRCRILFGPVFSQILICSSRQQISRDYPFGLVKIMTEMGLVVFPFPLDFI